MLTLSPGSVCDVCAEEYNLHCVPLSIPCGHIFCWSCCHKIVQKTLPRLQAACPFCSDHFISDDVRLIRINISEIGQVSPRWRDGLTEVLGRSPEDRFPLVEPSFSHARAEARRLEDKVAKVATRTCSFEEVSTLYKELEEWLTHDDNFHVKSYSLSSSAGLLRIVLMNHMAHSGATRKARGLEAALKAKLDDMESKVSKLETDLGRQQALYFQKVQECQALRAELTRYPSTSYRAADLPARPSTAAPTGLSEHRRTKSSGAAPTYNVSPMPSKVSRFAATHSRKASVSAPGSRPTTPARMTTPSVRSQTPTQGSVSSSRLRTPSPILPSRPRTIYVPASSPHNISRSHSDERERERERIHERWKPSPNVVYNTPTGKSKSTNYPPYFGSSTAPSRAHSSLSAATLPRIIITPTQSDEDVSGLDDEWELGEDGWELDEDGLEPDEDESELDEDGSETDEDGPELEEDGSEIDEDGSEIYEDELEQKPVYERWMPPPDSMTDPPIGKPINYPPFPLPGRARASLSANSATRLPQTATPVQQDENMWERGRMHSMPSQPSNIPTGKTVNQPSYSRPSFSSYAAVPPQRIPPVHPDQHERGRKRTHERWMPSQNVASNPPTGKSVNCPPYFGSSSAPGRTGF